MSNPDRMRDLMERYSDQMRVARPEVIGGIVAMREGGEYVQAVYFTSEAEARANEQVPPPPEVAAAMAEEMGDAVYFDLRRPRMMSPG
jgi:hypothetical protein